MMNLLIYLLWGLVILLVIMGSRRNDEKRTPLWASTIGIICLFIGLFVGIAWFSSGLVTTILLNIQSRASHAIDLGILVTGGMINIGLVLSCLLIPAARLLHLQPKRLIVYASIIALFYGFYSLIWWMSLKS